MTAIREAIINSYLELSFSLALKRKKIKKFLNADENWLRGHELNIYENGQILN